MTINLFDGEQLTEVEKRTKIPTEAEINKKYTDGEIRIITEQGRYPLEEVAKMFSNKTKYNDLIDYQRDYVWSTKNRSLLIESFIMNIPIPPIFLYERSYSYYEILDGKQRISAIVDFYNSKYALEGLEIWSELNGMRYCDLPVRIKEGLDRRYLSSIIMLKESEKDTFEVSKLKKLVFERLNSGGLKLFPQESRNAIFSGPFNNACKDLAENECFRKAWGIFKAPKRQISMFDEDEEEPQKKSLHMKDVELVLRFFAFRQLKDFDCQLNAFLDRYLDNANKYNSELIDTLSILFTDTIEFAYNLFDEEPFRLYQMDKNNKVSKSKKAVRTIYDPLMQVLSQYLDKKEFLLKNKEQVQIKYAELLISSSESFSGKLQHKATIENRIKLFNDMLISIIEAE